MPYFSFHSYNSILTLVFVCSTSLLIMSDLTVELTSPNGLQYSQPIGLFINNEWTKSSSDEKITAINPTYDRVACPNLFTFCPFFDSDGFLETNPKSLQYMLHPRTTLIALSMLLAQHSRTLNGETWIPPNGANCSTNLVTW